MNFSPFMAGFLLVVLLIGVLIIFKKTCWALVDGVYDSGENLVIKDKGQETIVQLNEIKKIDISLSKNFAIITLKTNDRFDGRIRYLPKFHLPFSPSKEIQEIEKRISKL